MRKPTCGSEDIEVRGVSDLLDIHASSWGRARAREGGGGGGARADVARFLVLISRSRSLDGYAESLPGRSPEGMTITQPHSKFYEMLSENGREDSPVGQ